MVGRAMLHVDYFDENALASQKELHHQFKTNKELFMKLLRRVRAYYDYFVMKRDNIVVWGFSAI
jgi:uncharacterized protein involved in tolerance to divalent cations